MIITEKTIDLTTNEEVITEREETKEEKLAREQLEIETSNFIAKQIAEAAARAELLDKLGITADEAKLLLG